MLHVRIAAKWAPSSPCEPRKHVAEPPQWDDLPTNTLPIKALGAEGCLLEEFADVPPPLASGVQVRELRV